MRITISDKLVSHSVQESSACAFAASIWDDSTDVWTAATPTTLRYRVDAENGSEIVGWTTVTPASTATITVTGSQNALADNCISRQRRQLTVEVNNGLDSAYSETHDYWVNNGART